MLNSFILVFYIDLDIYKHDAKNFPRNELSLASLTLRNMLLQTLVIHERTKIIYKYEIAVAVLFFQYLIVDYIEYLV